MHLTTLRVYRVGNPSEDLPLSRHLVPVRDRVTSGVTSLVIAGCSWQHTPLLDEVGIVAMVFQLVQLRHWSSVCVTSQVISCTKLNHS